MGFLSALALGLLRCFMSVVVQSPSAHRAPRAALPQGSAVTCHPYSSCSAAPPKSRVFQRHGPKLIPESSFRACKACSWARLCPLELPTLGPEGAPCNWALFSAGLQLQFEPEAPLPPSQHRAALCSLDAVKANESLRRMDSHSSEVEPAHREPPGW